MRASVTAAALGVLAVTAALGAAVTQSLAFGLWYAAAAWSLAPYPFERFVDG